MEWGPEAWVATYAAIVATGALFLEVRRWYESGPKIILRVSTGMTLLGHDDSEDITDLMIVNVTNRGDAPTTITHFGVVCYPNLWKRLRRKPSKQFIFPHPQAPGAPPIIPHVLQPGQQWAGLAHNRSDAMGDIEDGTFWVIIQATDRDRPYMLRIPKPKGLNILVGAEEV